MPAAVWGFVLIIGGMLWYFALKEVPSHPERRRGSTSRPAYRTTGTSGPMKTGTSVHSAFRRHSLSRPAAFAPTEKDSNLRSFQILNPEGEVHTVNTADPSSLFHGPVWTRILDCYTKEEFLRGRAFTRCISQEDRFSGYMVDIDGIEAFLPKRNAGYFYDAEKDVTGKCLALKVDMVYPNGPMQGKIILNAKSPWQHTRSEFKNLFSGKVVDVLALDHEHGYLVFPGLYEYRPDRRVYRNILVLLDETLQLGRASGIAADPGYLTGLYWKLRIQNPRGEHWLAEPLEVLI
jgi:hypothetical protein